VESIEELEENSTVLSVGLKLQLKKLKDN
jgi:hypothetical protein